MRLQDINPEAVQGMIAGMVRLGASRAYVLNVLGTLNSILTSAVQWGHKAQRLDRTRLVIPVEGEKQRGRTFTPDQAHQERSGNSTGLVFRGKHGGPVDMNSWRERRLAPLLKRLGIPRAGLHAFRHALSSVLVSEGANPKVAQKQLGHSDIRTTLDLYSHIIGDEQRKAVARAAESFMPTLLTGTGRVN